MRVYEVRCETVFQGNPWSKETFHVQASSIKTAMDRALRAHTAQEKREGTRGTRRVVEAREVDMRIVQ